MATPLERLRQFVIKAVEAETDANPLCRVRVTAKTWQSVFRDGFREVSFEMMSDREVIRTKLVGSILGIGIWLSQKVPEGYAAPIWTSQGEADSAADWFPTRLVRLDVDEPFDVRPPTTVIGPSRWDRLNMDDDS